MASTDLVTILSTDWVESTATRARLGEDRADRLQQQHDALLRDVIESHDGDVVKNSGDGVLATFRSTTDALYAAIAIQQRFEVDRRSAAGERIHIRVGVSAGDVVRRDEDIFGTPVVEAVRLESAAEPDQILCSELVRMLGRGRGGFDFELIGLLELKGLPEPVAVCSVSWQPTTVDVALPMPPELTSDTSNAFVGRGAELEEATEITSRAEQAHSIWLLGEPGIGKTRLAAEIATRAHAAGALVLYGRCDEQVRAPFQPLIDALRWFVNEQRDNEVASHLGNDPHPLVRLVPELHARVPGLAMPELATEIEQYRLFESVRSWLGSIAAERPVVYVVDDVHWADQPTLALLGHVARSAQRARLTIIATARDTDPDVSYPLTALVDELHRTNRSSRFEIAGLSTGEVARFLEPSELPRATVARLADETAGNPLFLGAVLPAVLADGSLPHELPTDVRAAVRRRVGRIGPGAQELLQVAALVGLEFSLDVAADAASVDDATGLERVEQAMSAGIVLEVGLDRFRFTHALVRDALVAELSASRRARVHAAIAAAIERRYELNLDEHFRALAQHYAASGGRDNDDLARDYAQRSARRSINMLAFVAAVEDFAFALQILERTPDHAALTRFELLFAKGETERLAGLNLAALTTMRLACVVARIAGDWDALARAAISFEDASWRPGLLGHEAVALLTESPEHELVDAQRIRVCASLGRALHYSGFGAQAKDATEQALRAARQLDDPNLLAHALMTTIQTLSAFRTQESRRVLELAHEVYGLADRLDPLDIALCGACQYAGVAAWCLGDRATSDIWLERYSYFSERALSRFNQFVEVCNRQVRALVDADLARAEELAHASLELGNDIGEDVDGVHGVKMFLIRREQGRLSELAPLMRMLLRANPSDAMWGPGLVVLLTEIGMYDEARPLLAELARDNFAALPRDMLFPGALCLMAEAAAALDVPDAAAAIAHELTPWHESGLSLGHTVAFIGAVNRYLALCASLLGRTEEAHERFERALQFNRRARATLWVAHTLAEWAALFSAEKNWERAAPLVTEARALADRHGLVAVAKKLDAVQLV